LGRFSAALFFTEALLAVLHCALFFEMPFGISNLQVGNLRSSGWAEDQCLRGMEKVTSSFTKMRSLVIRSQECGWAPLKAHWTLSEITWRDFWWLTGFSCIRKNSHSGFADQIALVGSSPGLF
jgi:hypothetical protein